MPDLDYRQMVEELAAHLANRGYTDSDVNEVYTLIDRGIGRREIAKRTGLTSWTIREICNKELGHYLQGENPSGTAQRAKR